MKENLNHYKPTEEQYTRFERINKMTEEQWDIKCARYGDCTICPLAIRQQLYSTEKYTCVYGITREQFELAMDNADCYF